MSTAGKIEDAVNTEITELLTKEEMKIQRYNKELDKLTGLEDFDQYGDKFRDLTTTNNIKTGYGINVINCVITYDSKNCIAILSQNDKVFMLNGYDLTTFKKSFSVPFEGKYIKMNLIEQNSDGSIFTIAY